MAILVGRAFKFLKMPLGNRQIQRTCLTILLFVLFFIFGSSVMLQKSVNTDTSLFKKKFELKHTSYERSDDTAVVGLHVTTCFKFTSRCEPSKNFDYDILGLDTSKDPVERIQISKDLYLGKSMLYKAYIYYDTVQITPKNKKFLKVATDLAFENKGLDSQITGDNKFNIPLKVLLDFNGKSLTNIKYDSVSKTKFKFPKSIEEVGAIGWFQVQNGIWIKYDSYITNPEKVISDLNVFFGRDSIDPRPKWELSDLPISFELDDTISSMGKLSPAPGSHKHDKEGYISLKRTGKAKGSPLPEINLLLDSKDNFKILQVADLHFSTGHGICRDTFPALETNVECLADDRTLAFVEKVLDLEKPDLVVLTGDQIFGESCPDSETALLKAVAPFIKRKIPYTFSFGNHDDEEGSLSASQLLSFVLTLPYSYASFGPSDVSGNGNYVWTVSPKNNKKAAAITLYFLDSHKYSPYPKTYPGYDWIKEDQIKFVYQEHEQLLEAQNAYNGIPLSLAFFHIPLTEYRELADANGVKRPMVGNIKEGVTAPFYNPGVRDALTDVGVSVVSVGHDHCNDYCMMHGKKPEGSKKSDDIWLCFGGAAGEGGYAGYGGTTRRLRTFQINAKTGNINSWKRLETAPEVTFDEQVLVKGGKVEF
ncbi:hydrolase activity protein [[Candida] boidinii]|nr:hydrolase activity protein [[Candida] boidinii]OWB71606.1 hydrolase activity protein [[Candida] boidinii]OWB77587.1 hydrolase activity protein [[Candida] boidinii]